MSKKRMRPFSNGTEVSFFFEMNCDGCKKSSTDYGDPDAGQCELQNALFDAQGGDGKIPLTIAKRIGFTKSGGIPDCKEKEPA